MCLVHRCAKAHRLPVPQYRWVMKARNNGAVEASEIGSIAGAADCMRVYDYMGVELHMFSVSVSVMDTDIIVCVCVCRCVCGVCVCVVCGVCVWFVII